MADHYPRSPWERRRRGARVAPATGRAILPDMCAMTPMMPTITPQEFVARWRDAGFGERQGAQSFFNDLCGLVGHATPAGYGDPEAFTFEKSVPGGFADAYFEEHFGWEFKGQDAQLDGAFDQLLRYQVHLKTPPLLIVSSFETIRVQTNFPGMETARYDVGIGDQASPAPSLVSSQAVLMANHGTVEACVKITLKPLNFDRTNYRQQDGHTMSLSNEIAEMRAEVRSDGYPMSIGELINLYRDGELDIHPEFQRFYRWSPEQKSRLIESILLGIPIPSIFVSQRGDGIWDVIDGLQRLSTIFELVGELQNEDGAKLPPLELRKTKYLPSLEGKTWDDNGAESGIGDPNKLIIRRSKIDIKIILRESSEVTKYELFQRLNTGGTRLSDQEIRNAILLMVNPDAYRWIAELAQDENFQACIPITDQAKSEQFDLELVTRFLVFWRLDEPNLRSIGDIGEFLTDRIVEFAQSRAFFDLKDQESNAFQYTFVRLARSLAEDVFRKYDTHKQSYTGPFSISAFEPIAMGFGYHYETYANTSAAQIPNIETIAKRLWTNAEFTRNSGSGVRASTRIRSNIPLGRSLFEL